ncbi:hypothetical protein GGE07_006015 [Sinorhizobium terangae]|nr:hypothetical protein [Sinorhizobium terangae]
MSAVVGLLFASYLLIDAFEGFSILVGVGVLLATYGLFDPEFGRWRASELGSNQVYHNWLDRWDERRARRGEEAKKVTDFILDAGRAIPGEKRIETIDEFCVLADQALSDSSFYDEPSGSTQGFERDDGWLRFPSGISTDVEENNVVWAKITESGSLDQALVIFHHWNASARNRQIAKFSRSVGSRLSRLLCLITSSAAVPARCTPIICLVRISAERSNL